TTNRAEFAEVFFGVPMLGAIVSPLDYWWSWDDAYAALEQIQPKVLIVGSAQAKVVAEAGTAVRQAGVEHVLCLDPPPSNGTLRSYQEVVATAPALTELVPVAPSDPALIMFTSGSTGRSKGAVHTHGGLVSTAMIMYLELGLADGERTLHFLP